jgi:hypothetical protein
MASNSTAHLLANNAHIVIRESKRIQSCLAGKQGFSKFPHKTKTNWSHKWKPTQFTHCYRIHNIFLQEEHNKTFESKHSPFHLI